MDFSEDGRYLASAGKDTTVRVWDLSGSTPTVLRHSAAVVDIAFAGNTLATAVSGDPLVQLWEDGRHKATLARHKSPVRAIRWLAGELVTVGQDGETVRWNLDEDRVQEALCHRLKSPALADEWRRLDTAVGPLPC